MDSNIVTVDLGPNYEWVARLEWPQGETQGGPGRIVIEPATEGTYPAGGLSQTVLRELDFKQAIDTLRRQHAGGKRAEKAKAAVRQQMNDLLLAHAEVREITDIYLSLLSHAYVRAVSDGQEKPLEYLAELTGQSHAAIKNHLWQATRRGLLERSPGRAGGKTTAKAKNLIAPLMGLHSLTDSRRLV
jgi:hypothetical protein